MKIRFSVESIPKPRGFWEFIAAVFIERVDIVSRAFIQYYIDEVKKQLK